MPPRPTGAGDRPPSRPFAAQPPSQPFAAQPPSQPFAAQPPSQPFAAQPPSQPFAAQLPSQPFAAQPPSRPFAAQPPGPPRPGRPPGQPFPGEFGPAGPGFGQGGYPVSDGSQFDAPDGAGRPDLGWLPIGRLRRRPRQRVRRRPRLPGRSTILVLISALAGLVTYTMGFVDWVSFDGSTAGDDLSRWGEGLTALPGFFSYEVLLNPGKFLILMGALAVAAALLVVPAYRRALPVLAVLASGGWLALLSAVLTLPVVVDVGAGAIIALVTGFLQAAALVAAAFIQGLEQRS